MHIICTKTNVGNNPRDITITNVGHNTPARHGYQAGGCLHVHVLVGNPNSLLVESGTQKPWFPGYLITAHRN